MKEEKKGTEKRQLRKIDRQALMQSGWTGGLGTGPDDCMPYDKYVELDDRGVISGSIYVCGLGWFTPGITIYGSGSGSGSYGCGSGWESGSNWGSEWGSWGSIDWGSNWGSGSDWGSGSGNDSYNNGDYERLGMEALSKMKYDLEHEKIHSYKISDIVNHPIITSINLELNVKSFISITLDRLAKDPDRFLWKLGNRIGLAGLAIGGTQSIVALFDGDKTPADWAGAASTIFGAIACIPPLAIPATGMSMILGIVAIAIDDTPDQHEENI